LKACYKRRFIAEIALGLFGINLSKEKYGKAQRIP
jgi:hypothetical protein